ncbi:MAG: hypothetical protein Q9163_002947 [Psora crenata]
MWNRLVGKSDEANDQSAKSNRRRSNGAGKRSTRQHSGSLISTDSQKKSSSRLSHEDDPRSNPTFTNTSSTSRAPYEGVVAPSIASKYATALGNGDSEQYILSGVDRKASLGDKMPKSRSSRGEAYSGPTDEMRDGGQTSERRSKPSTSIERHERTRGIEKVERRDRSDRQEKEEKTHRRSGGSKRFSTTHSGGGNRSKEPVEFNGEYGGPGLMKFPEQHHTASSAVPVGIPSQRPETMSSHVHDQFPGQFPIDPSGPYRPPLASNEGGPGLAAEYYGDTGESVAQQPGYRKHSPSLIIGAEPHLQPASSVAAPPPEPSASGGVGAAASFFSADFNGAGSTFSAEDHSTYTEAPSRPDSKYHSSSIPLVSAAGAAAAGAAAGYATSGGIVDGSSPPQQMPGYITTSIDAPSEYSVNMTQVLPTPGQASNFSSSSRPPKVGKTSTHSANIPLYAVGMTGNATLAAGTHPHNQHPSPQHASMTQQYVATPLKHPRRRHGPLAAVVDFFRDPDGVAQFEEYSEIIGVCQGCFEPGSSPRDAPRKHRFYKRRSKEIIGSTTRISKQHRYSSSEDEDRRKNDSPWLGAGLGAGLAGYGLGKFGEKVFEPKHDVENTYDLTSGHFSHQNRGQVSGKSSKNMRPRIPSYERLATDDTSNGKVYKKETHDRVPGVHPRTEYTTGRRSRSRSWSGERQTYAGDAVMGAVVGSPVPASSIRRKSESPGSLFASEKRRSPERRREHRKLKKKKTGNGLFSFLSPSSSCSSLELTPRSNKEKRRKGKVSDKKIRNDHDAEAALLGLGAATAALALKGRRSSNKSTKDTAAFAEAKEKPQRHPRRSKQPSISSEEDWESASEDYIDSDLAFGSPSSLSSHGSLSPQTSGTDKWDWRWNRNNRRKRSPRTVPQIRTLPRAEGAAGAAAAVTAGMISEQYHTPGMESTSSLPLEHVYPVPTSDPGSFDVRREGSVASFSPARPVSRPEAVPIQQPKPVTPIVPNFYTSPGTDGRSYSAPTEPPAFPPPSHSSEVPVSSISGTSSRYGDGVHEPSGDCKLQRRGTSPARFGKDAISSFMPHLPRPSTRDDSAAVRFALSAEQDENDRKQRRRRRQEEVVEEERKESQAKRLDPAEKRIHERKQKPNASPAVDIGVVGNAISALVTADEAKKELSKKKEEERKRDEASKEESRERRRERRKQEWVREDGEDAMRRDERRRKNEREHEQEVDAGHESKAVQEDIIAGRCDTSPHDVLPSKERSPQELVGSKPYTYEDYQSFFTPTEILNNSDGQAKTTSAEHEVGANIDGSAAIVEIVPKGADGRPDEPEWSLADTIDEINQTKISLPWQVPRLKLVRPTPPLSRVPTPCCEPIECIKEEKGDAKGVTSSRSSSKVTWGENRAHEYTDVTSIENREESVQRSPTEPVARRRIRDYSDSESEEREKPRNDEEQNKSISSITSNPSLSFGNDNEFAATLAAAAEHAGFDPSIIIDDPTYRRRGSPPGSNNHSMPGGFDEDDGSYLSMEDQRIHGKAHKSHDQSDVPNDRNLNATVEDMVSGGKQPEPQDGLDGLSDYPGNAQNVMTSKKSKRSRKDSQNNKSSTHSSGATRETRTVYDTSPEVAISTATSEVVEGQDSTKRSRKKPKQRTSGFEDAAPIISSVAAIESSQDTEAKSKKGSLLERILGKSTENLPESSTSKGKPEEATPYGSWEPKTGSTKSDDRKSKVDVEEKGSTTSRGNRSSGREKGEINEDGDNGVSGRITQDLPAEENDSTQDEKILSAGSVAQYLVHNDSETETSHEEESEPFLGTRLEPPGPLNVQSPDEEPPGLPDKEVPSPSARGQWRPPDISVSSVQQPHRATPSPTAVPFRYRSPRPAPGYRRSASQSPFSSAQDASEMGIRQKPRPRSTGFKSSREMRPLWLVERYQPHQEPSPHESYPPLPESHSTSAASSVRGAEETYGAYNQEQENVESGYNEQNLPVDGELAARQSDLLDSQQATPTAASFDHAASYNKSPTLPPGSPSSPANVRDIAIGILVGSSAAIALGEPAYALALSESCPSDDEAAQLPMGENGSAPAMEVSEPFNGEGKAFEDEPCMVPSQVSRVMKEERRAGHNLANPNAQLSISKEDKDVPIEAEDSALRSENSVEKCDTISMNSKRRAGQKIVDVNSELKAPKQNEDIPIEATDPTLRVKYSMEARSAIKPTNAMQCDENKVTAGIESVDGPTQTFKEDSSGSPERHHNQSRGTIHMLQSETIQEDEMLDTMESQSNTTTLANTLAPKDGLEQTKSIQVTEATYNVEPLNATFSIELSPSAIPLPVDTDSEIESDSLAAMVTADPDSTINKDELALSPLAVPLPEDTDSEIESDSLAAMVTTDPDPIVNENGVALSPSAVPLPADTDSEIESDSLAAIVTADPDPIVNKNGVALSPSAVPLPADTDSEIESDSLAVKVTADPDSALNKDELALSPSAVPLPEDTDSEIESGSVQTRSVTGDSASIIGKDRIALSPSAIPLPKDTDSETESNSIQANKSTIHSHPSVSLGRIESPASDISLAMDLRSGIESDSVQANKITISPNDAIAIQGVEVSPSPSVLPLPGENDLRRDSQSIQAIETTIDAGQSSSTGDIELSPRTIPLPEDNDFQTDNESIEATLSVFPTGTLSITKETELVPSVMALSKDNNCDLLGATTVRILSKAKEPADSEPGDIRGTNIQSNPLATQFSPSTLPSPNEDDIDPLDLSSKNLLAEAKESSKSKPVQISNTSISCDHLAIRLSPSAIPLPNSNDFDLLDLPPKDILAEAKGAANNDSGQASNSSIDPDPLGSNLTPSAILLPQNDDLDLLEQPLNDLPAEVEELAAAGSSRGTKATIEFNPSAIVNKIEFSPLPIPLPDDNNFDPLDQPLGGMSTEEAVVSRFPQGTEAVVNVDSLATTNMIELSPSTIPLPDDNDSELLDQPLGDIITQTKGSAVSGFPQGTEAVVNSSSLATSNRIELSPLAIPLPDDSDSELLDQPLGDIMTLTETQTKESVVSGFAQGTETVVNSSSSATSNRIELSPLAIPLPDDSDFDLLGQDPQAEAKEPMANKYPQEAKPIADVKPGIDLSPLAVPLPNDNDCDLVDQRPQDLLSEAKRPMVEHTSEHGWGSVPMPVEGTLQAMEEPPQAIEKAPGLEAEVQVIPLPNSNDLYLQESPSSNLLAQAKEPTSIEASGHNSRSGHVPISTSQAVAEALEEEVDASAIPLPDDDDLQELPSKIPLAQAEDPLLVESSIHISSSDRVPISTSQAVAEALEEEVDASAIPLPDDDDLQELPSKIPLAQAKDQMLVESSTYNSSLGHIPILTSKAVEETPEEEVDTSAIPFPDDDDLQELPSDNPSAQAEDPVLVESSMHISSSDGVPISNSQGIEEALGEEADASTIPLPGDDDLQELPSDNHSVRAEDPMLVESSMYISSSDGVPISTSQAIGKALGEEADASTIPLPADDDLYLQDPPFTNLMAQIEEPMDNKASSRRITFDSMAISISQPTNNVAGQEVDMPKFEQGANDHFPTLPGNYDEEGKMDMKAKHITDCEAKDVITKSAMPGAQLVKSEQAQDSTPITPLDQSKDVEDERLVPINKRNDTKGKNLKSSTANLQEGGNGGPAAPIIGATDVMSEIPKGGQDIEKALKSAPIVIRRLPESTRNTAASISADVVAEGLGQLSKYRDTETEFNEHLAVPADPNGDYDIGVTALEEREKVGVELQRGVPFSFTNATEEPAPKEPTPEPQDDFAMVHRPQVFLDKKLAGDSALESASNSNDAAEHFLPATLDESSPSREDAIHHKNLEPVPASGEDVANASTGQLVGGTPAAPYATEPEQKNKSENQRKGGQAYPGRPKSKKDKKKAKRPTGVALDPEDIRALDNETPPVVETTKAPAVTALEPTSLGIPELSDNAQDVGAKAPENVFVAAKNKKGKKKNKSQALGNEPDPKELPEPASKFNCNFAAADTSIPPTSVLASSGDAFGTAAPEVSHGFGSAVHSALPKSKKNKKKSKESKAQVSEQENNDVPAGVAAPTNESGPVDPGIAGAFAGIGLGDISTLGNPGTQLEMESVEEYAPRKVNKVGRRPMESGTKLQEKEVTPMLERVSIEEMVSATSSLDISEARVIPKLEVSEEACGTSRDVRPVEERQQGHKTKGDEQQATKGEDLISEGEATTSLSGEQIGTSDPSVPQDANSKDGGLLQQDLSEVTDNLLHAQPKEDGSALSKKEKITQTPKETEAAVCEEVVATFTEAENATEAAGSNLELPVTLEPADAPIKPWKIGEGLQEKTTGNEAQEGEDRIAPQGINSKATVAARGSLSTVKADPELPVESGTPIVLKHNISREALTMGDSSTTVHAYPEVPTDIATSVVFQEKSSEDTLTAGDSTTVQSDPKPEGLKNSEPLDMTTGDKDSPSTVNPTLTEEILDRPKKPIEQQQLANKTANIDPNTQADALPTITLKESDKDKETQTLGLDKYGMEDKLLKISDRQTNSTNPKGTGQPVYDEILNSQTVMAGGDGIKEISSQQELANEVMPKEIGDLQDEPLEEDTKGISQDSYINLPRSAAENERGLNEKDTISKTNQGVYDNGGAKAVKDKHSKEFQILEAIQEATVDITDTPQTLGTTGSKGFDGDPTVQASKLSEDEEKRKQVRITLDDPKTIDQSPIQGAEQSEVLPADTPLSVGSIDLLDAEQEREYNEKYALELERQLKDEADRDLCHQRPSDHALPHPETIDIVEVSAHGSQDVLANRTSLEDIVEESRSRTRSKQGSPALREDGYASLKPGKKSKKDKKRKKQQPIIWEDDTATEGVLTGPFPGVEREANSIPPDLGEPIQQQHQGLGGGLSPGGGSPSLDGAAMGVQGDNANYFDTQPSKRVEQDVGLGHGSDHHQRTATDSLTLARDDNTAKSELRDFKEGNEATEPSRNAECNPVLALKSKSEQRFKKRDFDPETTVPIFDGEGAPERSYQEVVDRAYSKDASSAFEEDTLQTCSHKDGDFFASHERSESKDISKGAETATGAALSIAAVATEALSPKDSREIERFQDWNEESIGAVENVASQKIITEPSEQNLDLGINDQNSPNNAPLPVYLEEHITLSPARNGPQRKDSAVHVSDSPTMPETENMRRDERDSGYRDHEICPSNSGEARNEVEQDLYSGELEIQSRVPERGFTQSYEDEPEDRNVSPKDEKEPVQREGLSAAQLLPLFSHIGNDNKTTMPESTSKRRRLRKSSGGSYDSDDSADSGFDIQKRRRRLEALAEEQREPSPVSSTTKERSSVLFDSSPSGRDGLRELSEHAGPVEHPERDSYGNEDLQQESKKPVHEQGWSFRTIEDGAREGRPSIFGGPIPEDDANSRLTSDEKRGRRVLRTISERSNEQRSHSPLQHGGNSAASNISSPTQGVAVGDSAAPLHDRISTGEQRYRSPWLAADQEKRSRDLERSLSRNQDQVSSRASVVSKVPSIQADLHSPRIGSPTSIPAIIRTPDQVRSASGQSFRSSGTPPLRRMDRSVSSDLRSASKKSEAKIGAKLADEADPYISIPSSSTFDPFTDKGKNKADMADYEGWGDVRGQSPMSPTRPHSMRKRQSMQFAEMEQRLAMLASENGLLQNAKSKAERRLEEQARDHSQQRQTYENAIQEHKAYIAERDSTLNRLNLILDGLRQQVTHLTEANEELRQSQSVSGDGHTHQEWERTSRELEGLRAQHARLATEHEDIVMREVEAVRQEKDIQLQELRDELEDAKEQVRKLQEQIAASSSDDDDVEYDDDYFDTKFHELCKHLTTWVTRFSKLSDNRRCYLAREIRNERHRALFEDSMLDGSEVDDYLQDRRKRRDVFMSVTMSLIFKHIFAHYLFGMDTEHLQKLKILDQTLQEVGPPAAVHKWRATTLTLLSRRPAFKSQRDVELEAVVEDIWNTLSSVLPQPPTAQASQCQESLRRILNLAVDLFIDMRLQRAEYTMLPPPEPDFDTNGDINNKLPFKAVMMNERSGAGTSNEEIEEQGAYVRLVLFPLVVKNADDDPFIVCPAQVHVAPLKKGKTVRVISAQGERAKRLNASTEDIPMEGGMF